MEQPRSPEEWGEIFEEVRPTYVAFCDRVEDHLEAILDEEGPQYSFAYSRVDSRNAFVERISRGRRDGLSIDDPFLDLADFARVEIAAHSIDDLELIEELVRREFDVDENESISIAEAAEANAHLSPQPVDHRLVYRTAKLVASLSTSRAEAWRAFGGLRVTIDLRTRIQDAWDGFDEYYLTYYRLSSFPEGARQAIEEAIERCVEADDAIAAVWREVERADETYEAAIADGRVDLPLDARSLGAYLEKSEVAVELVAIAEGAGMRRDEDRFNNWVLEQRGLWLLRRARLGSIAELDEWLRASMKRMPALLSDVSTIAQERGFQPYAHPADVVAFALLVLTRADAETVALAEYREELEYALNTLIGNPVHTEADEEQN